MVYSLLLRFPIKSNQKTAGGEEKMVNNLASNIRTFRKERKLTQEQLAEVFNVTVGAVHKWEAGMSTPDLAIIMEMADFFDTSLDVLIGFDVRDNRINALAERLGELTRLLDPSGPAEAEKALKKYPHSFQIVRQCAYLYLSIGVNRTVNEKYLDRAKELFEEAIRLFSQNDDPNMSEEILYGQLAIIHQLKGEIDEGLETYKAHNPGGMYNVRIGQLLAFNTDRYEEAEEYLSWALTDNIGNRINTIIAMAFCAYLKGELKKARELIEAGMNDHKLFGSEGPNFFDRLDCIYLTGLACVELTEGHKQKAGKIMKEIKEIADRFDANPNYDISSVKFISIKKPYAFTDTSGDTCNDVVINTIDKLNCPELLDIWKSIN